MFSPRLLAAACSAALVFSAPLAAAATTSGPVAAGGHVAGARGVFHTAQSNNWSGYNVGALSGGGLLSSISGSFVVPAASAHQAGQSESSATWVGLGGGCVESSCLLADPTLIQAGTEQDVSSTGQASYYSWYELVPAPSVRTPLAVRPGDTVVVDIATTLPELWTIHLTDQTTGDTWSTTVPYPSTMDTGEWIEETPLSIGTNGTGLTSLPNLGTVSFDKAMLNGAPAGLTSAEEIQLTDSSGHPVATPSAPDPDRDGFADCTFATTCPAPSAS